MKNAIILFLVIAILPTFGFSQSIDNIDYISPFHEGIAAIKKDSQWGFINKDGTLIIDFRKDVVLTKTDNSKYPIFKNNRCKIKQLKDGVSYFGFIDSTGKEVIKPRFLNATNFKDEIAIALLLEKDTVGSNKMLKKPVVSYEYFEVAINPKGKVVHYIIERPTHLTLSKESLKNPPTINSKMLSPSVFMVRDNNDKWALKKLNN